MANETQKPSPEAESPIQDRRNQPRVDLEVRVNFVSEHNFFTGFTRDISQGGLFIATKEIRPVGTRFRIKFSLPGGGPFETEVEVRWTTEPSAAAQDGDTSPGMGVQFVELPADALSTIKSFVQKRESILFDEV